MKVIELDLTMFANSGCHQVNLDRPKVDPKQFLPLLEMILELEDDPII